MPKQLETLQSAADRLGLHPKSLRRYIAAGQLTGYKIGQRALRVDPAEVDALARPIPTSGSAA